MDLLQLSMNLSNSKIKILNVTEDQKERARSFSLNVISETYNRFNYDRRDRLKKIAWGKLGEEVFATFLSTHCIECLIDYEIYLGETNTDVTDFHVNNMTIDLKVGTKHFHKRLLIVKTYFDNGNQSDFYVAINFYDNGSTAKIFGYATKEDVSKAPIFKWDKTKPVEDYTLLYADLKPIDDLVKILVK